MCVDAACEFIYVGLEGGNLGITVLFQIFLEFSKTSEVHANSSCIRLSMTLEWKSNLLVDETFVDVGKVLKNKNNLLVILSDLRLKHGQDTVWW